MQTGERCRSEGQRTGQARGVEGRGDKGHADPYLGGFPRRVRWPGRAAVNIEVIYLGWAVAALAMFRLCRPAIAALASYLGGWILLPVGAYPAGSADPVFAYWIVGVALPSDMLVTKAWVAAGSALLGAVAFDRDTLRRLRPRWIDAPVVLWCLWPGVAAAFADQPRPSAVLASLYLAGSWGLPWLLGRLYFANREGQLLLVKGLVVSALACLPFSLFEGAFGPTLYEWVYGPHPFRFDGDVRYVGFRPLGFFENGNQFGLWISLCALAALWLARTSAPDQRSMWRWIAAAVVTMAIAAQSMGALLLLALGAFGLWACGRVRPRAMLVGATALLVVGGAVYVSGVVPLERIAKDTRAGREVVTAFRAIGRGSFTWRVAQDQKLMPVAMARPMTGSATWDWWRPYGTRPWSLSLLVVGQFGVTGLLLVLTTLLGPALTVAWSAPRASAWRPEGLPLLVTALVLLTVVDALLNSFIFFPAIVAAGGLAATTAGLAARPPARRASAVRRSSPA